MRGWFRRIPFKIVRAASVDDMEASFLKRWRTMAAFSGLASRPILAFSAIAV
jgi:hypothetical protein